LRERNRAILNILEDVAESEQNLRGKTVELQEANGLIEKEKEQTESILRFLKSIGDGVVATDLAGRIIFFNEAAEKLTGFDNETAMEKNAAEILALYGEKKRDLRYDVVKDTLGSESNPLVANEHFFIRRKSGDNISVSFSASLIFDTQKKKQGCIIVIRDPWRAADGSPYGGRR